MQYAPGVMKEMCCPDMRLVHFKVGDAAEVMKKEDFIIAEEHDSASDTFEGEDTGCSFESFMDTSCFTSPALSTEESSWQVNYTTRLCLLESTVLITLQIFK